MKVPEVEILLILVGTQKKLLYLIHRAVQVPKE